MTKFKRLSSITPQGEENFVTIASGPVIIKDNKVLLDKHGDNFWKFPGGAVESDNNFEEITKRRVKEELGIEVELKSEPYVISFIRKTEDRQEFVILLHYLAEIVSGEPQANRDDIDQFAWHDIDNLPDDCAPNIRQAVEYFKS